MALMERLVKQEKEPIYFLFETLGNKVVYIKTNSYVDSQDILKRASEYGLLLQHVNTDADREPVAHAAGYFVTAQRVDISTISKNSRIWEILK